MSLSIVSITPANASMSTPIDSKIVIELTDQIDPFTVPNGVSLYVSSKTLWDNQELVALDTKYSEVLDIGDTNTFFPFKYQLNNTTLTITPSISLLPDKTFYIDIFPGNDATRYISKQTTGAPLIVGANGNKVSINSAYTGSNNSGFDITFSSSDGINTDTVDVSKGIVSVGSFKFENNKDIDIGELTFSISGVWEIGDSISIPVFKAVGLSDIYRTTFTTSKYTTTTPTSHKIEFLSDNEEQLRVIKTHPEDMSMDNKSINPIVIKFNKPLKADQILTDKIIIKRLGLDTGTSKNIAQYYKIENDTLKVYMISTTR